LSRAGLAAVGLGVIAAAGLSEAAPLTQVGGAELRPMAFAELAGWARDDHAAAFAAFRKTCAPPVVEASLRPAVQPTETLARICAAALATNEAPRLFFERHFAPFEVAPATGRGFLTGYFEPEIAGSLAPSDAFAAPLLARPDDLVTLVEGETPPGLDPSLRAARQTAAGLEPYPDRAAIEDGALGPAARALVYLRDAVEVFIVQVQGSARVRLPDGAVVRLAYAGRNGHPYTSIGRILVEEGRIAPAEMSLDRLTGWLRANPVAARGIMRRNASYVFFRIAEELAPAEGPIGGAGAPLTAGRSLAVDRSLWSYGLPVWLEGELPQLDGPPEPLARLMIAQDTGSAILGPARGDFFFGSGPEAGTRAGLLRHPVRFVVLLPRP
jgi:membrane-bound lytic murein transglycosylase A